MKPLKDEEAADGILRKQSQNAVYQTCATLAGGEALAAANADPTGYAGRMWSEGDIDLYIIKRFYVVKLSYKNFPETIHQ